MLSLLMTPAMMAVENRFTRNVVDAVVKDGQSATFSVEVSAGSPAAMYQWQSAPKDSTNFTNITGPNANSASYTVTAALANHGTKYQVVVTRGATGVPSQVGTLQVIPAGWKYELAAEFSSQVYTSPEGLSLGYRLYSPSGAPAAGYPMVVVLPGRDADGKPMLNLAAARFVAEQTSRKCHILVPICPFAREWSQFVKTGVSVFQAAQSTEMRLLRETITDLQNGSLPINDKQLYLLGFNGGGYAVWDLLQREGIRWAAAVPVLGGGDSGTIASVASLPPIWAAHSWENNALVPVERTREMVTALESAGNSVLYSEYNKILSSYEHFCGYDAGSWVSGEKFLTEWMFAQVRGQPKTFAEVAGSTALPPWNQCPGKSGGGPITSYSAFSTQWKAKRDSLFSAKSANQGKMVFLGDSITELWTDVAGAFPKFNRKVVNMGLSGDMSRGVLTRIQDVIDVNPMGVSLLIGTNDLNFFGPNSDAICGIAVNNITLIIEALRAHNPDLPIVVSTVMPTGFNRQDTMNGALTAALGSFSKVFICDINTRFKNDGYVARRYYNDGLHPSTLGYQVWKEELDRVFTTAGLYGVSVPTVSFSSAPQSTPEGSTAAVTPGPIPVYPYANYNNGRMDPQRTGWPLTDTELTYALISEWDRKPGKEVVPNQHKPDMWAVTPAARQLEIPPDNKPSDWLSYHSRIVGEVRAKQGAIDILLVGDSITQGWGGCVTQAGSAFKTSWTTNFPTNRYTTVNAGILGDRVENVLWRLEHGLIDSSNAPKVVVLLIGTNNAANASADYPNSIAAGVRLCVDNVRNKSPRSHVVVVKLLPRGDGPKVKIDPINRAIDALNLTADARVRVIGLTSDFSNPDGSLKTQGYSDGILHLNDTGYGWYAARLKPVIEQILEDEGNSATVTLSLSAAATQPVTVPMTTSGTASVGTAYVAPVTSVVIPAGSLTKTFDVQLIDNTRVEGNKTVVFTMGTPTNAIMGDVVSHTLTITEDDVAAPPVVRPQSAGGTVLVTEGGTATVKIRLSAQPLANTTVNVTREAGDTDLLPVTTSVAFTTVDWNTDKDVVIRANADADTVSGVAQFSFSVGSLKTQVMVAELDTVVAPTNRAPTVANAIPAQTATAGTAYSYAIPANTFADADSDPLTFSVTGLPSWATFTVGTRTISGTPPVAAAAVTVVVTANDLRGGTVSANLSLTVSAAANRAPTVANAIPAQTATAGTAYSYEIPANTFADADSDPLTLSVTGLPSWATFTVGTRTISGTPPVAAAAVTAVVTADDERGGTISANLSLTVSAASANPGDLNADRTVNILDLILVRTAYASLPTDVGWDARADTNGDGVINISDLIEVRRNFARTYP
jgi:lysophospholipase L1-like esterase/predicted peptidase